MARHVTVTEIHKDGTPQNRTARDAAHAARMAERIQKTRPESRVTTKDGKH